MTFSKIALVVTLTAATLGAATAEAHTVRPTANPLALIDALDMPGLNPARALMAEMLDDLDAPHRPRVYVPDVPSRNLMPFFGFRWFGLPIVRRDDGPRCEVIYTPYAGRIETCTLAPRSPERRTPHGVMRDLDLRLHSY